MNAPDSLSVVVPAWNSSCFLAEALASVIAEGADEIIVVDDGSNDDTCAIAASFPEVTVLSQPRRGIAAARNAGVRASRGTLLAFIDSDDIWAPGRLELQLAALAENPDAIVLGLSEEFVSPELTPHERAALRPKPGRIPGFLAGAMLLRRSTFGRVGDFDESLPVGEVVAWFHRAHALGITQLVLPELVLSRRLHRDNFTRGREQRAAYALLARHLVERQLAADEAAGRDAPAPKR